MPSDPLEYCPQFYTARIAALGRSNQIFSQERWAAGTDGRPGHDDKLPSRDNKRQCREAYRESLTGSVPSQQSTATDEYEGAER